jgi:hypothetical protein
VAPTWRPSEVGGCEMPDNSDPQYWRDRAKAARALAMKDPRCELRMLGLADFFERLAERIDQRAELQTRRKLRPPGMSRGRR